MIFLGNANLRSRLTYNYTFTCCYSLTGIWSKVSLGTLGGQLTIASRHMSKVINIFHSFGEAFSYSLTDRNPFDIKTLNA